MLTLIYKIYLLEEGGEINEIKRYCCSKFAWSGGFCCQLVIRNYNTGLWYLWNFCACFNRKFTMCSGYFVMCHKIAKRGTIFIYYLLSGIIYSVMGFIPMLPIMLVAGILGEACIGGKDNYINNGRIAISYVVSQVIYALHGFFFILFLGVEGLVKTFPNLFTVEKAQMVKGIFFNPKNMVIILLIELIASILGTLLGKYIYNKFFNKSITRAGILS